MTKIEDKLAALDLAYVHAQQAYADARARRDATGDDDETPDMAAARDQMARLSAEHGALLKKATGR